MFLNNTILYKKYILRNFKVTDTVDRIFERELYRSEKMDFYQFKQEALGNKTFGNFTFG